MLCCRSTRPWWLCPPGGLFLLSQATLEGRSEATQAQQPGEAKQLLEVVAREGEASWGQQQEPGGWRGATRTHTHAGDRVMSPLPWEFLQRMLKELL